MLGLSAKQEHGVCAGARVPLLTSENQSERLRTCPAKQASAEGVRGHVQVVRSGLLSSSVDTLALTRRGA